MFDRTTKNEANAINHDVTELADTLDELLKSYGSKTKDEVDVARHKAEALLKETRAKLHGRPRVSQATRDASQQVDSWIRDKPWHGAGIATAVGIFIGALLASRR